MENCWSSVKQARGTSKLNTSVQRLESYAIQSLVYFLYTCGKNQMAVFIRIFSSFSKKRGSSVFSVYCCCPLSLETIGLWRRSPFLLHPISLAISAVPLVLVSFSCPRRQSIPRLCARSLVPFGRLCFCSSKAFISGARIWGCWDPAWKTWKVRTSVCMYVHEEEEKTRHRLSNIFQSTFENNRFC